MQKFITQNYFGYIMQEVDDDRFYYYLYDHHGKQLEQYSDLDQALHGLELLQENNGETNEK